MTDFINYTSATGLMFTSYGLMRYIKYHKDMDSCTKYNLLAGMGCYFITSGIMVKRAISS